MRHLFMPYANENCCVFFSTPTVWSFVSQMMKALTLQTAETSSLSTIRGLEFSLLSAFAKLRITTITSTQLSFCPSICQQSGFGGLGVACWPLVPKFVGSNPAEAVGFLMAKKSSARLPPEGK
jgi:hypothetical protein